MIVEQADIGLAATGWPPPEAPIGLLSAAEVQVRQELARELHDRVTPILTAMLVEMEQHRRAHPEHPIAAHLSQFQDDTRLVLSNLREMLSGLRGREDMGGRFVESLRELAVNFTAETGIPVQVRVSGGWPRRLSTISAVNLHHIITEALNNVRRHSGAHRASVSLRVKGGQAVVTVRDWGRGFLWQVRRDEGGSYGILGMRERAHLLGGELVVEPARPTGIIVRVVVPEAGLE
jgi:two-component system sensor histidine kinase UhpB